MSRWIFPFALLLISVSPSLHAAMTVGWKIPIELLEGSDPQFREKIHKLDHPPKESAFFQPGDELWDISKALPWQSLMPEAERPQDPSGDPFTPQAEETSRERIERTRKLPAPEWTGDWFVWNARSGMVIASGTRNEIISAERALDLNHRPTLVSTKLELVDRVSKVSQSLTLVSRSDEAASIVVEGWEAQITTQPRTDINMSHLDLTTRWPGQVKDQQWEVRNGFGLIDEERTLIARESDWELWGTATMESVEGTPRSGQRFIEENGELHPWPFSRFGPQILSEVFEQDRVICWFSGAMLGLGSALEPSIEVPADLQSRIHGHFFSPARAYSSLLPSSPAFAGYDPLSNMLVVVRKASQQDTLDDILLDCSFDPPVNQWTETNEAAGSWYLLAHSGEEGHISRKTGEANELMFKIRASYSATESSDLAYTIDAISAGSSRARLDSHLAVPLEKPVNIGSYKTADGTEIPIEVTVHSKEIYK